MRARRIRLTTALLLLAASLLGGTLLFIVLRPASSSGTAQIGLAYGRTHMVWQSGPQLQSDRTTTLGQLRYVLPLAVPRQVRQDINVTDLIRHYGATQRVDLVVLHGIFNSLPPDEGVTVNGSVAVVLDSHTHRVLLMTF